MAQCAIFGVIVDVRGVRDNFIFNLRAIPALIAGKHDTVLVTNIAKTPKKYYYWQNKSSHRLTFFVSPEAMPKPPAE